MFYDDFCYNLLKYNYFRIKGKKVKTIKKPSFNKLLIIKTIALFIKKYIQMS